MGKSHAIFYFHALLISKINGLRSTKVTIIKMILLYWSIVPWNHLVCTDKIKYLIVYPVILSIKSVAHFVDLPITKPPEDKTLTEQSDDNSTSSDVV